MKAKRIYINGIYLICLIFISPKIQLSGQTKYAILINTGYNKEENSEDYYDQLSRVYDYLLNESNYNEQDIFIYSADGTDNGQDYFCGYYMDSILYCDSDPDLDGDGDDDITGEASKENINDKLLDLQSSMTSDDFLFIYLIGPVYHVINELSCDYYGSGFTFWESDRQQNNSLATNMNGISNCDVFFFDARSEDGIDIEDYDVDRRYIVKNTTFETEKLGVCDVSSGYSNYYQHFIDALFGENEGGNPVDADYDQNGLVSLAEANKYAVQQTSVNHSEVYWHDLLRAKNMTLNGYIGCQSIRLLNNDYYYSESQSLIDCYFEIEDLSIINSNISIEANYDIIFHSDIVIDNGSNLVLDAGQNVVIQAGFELRSGSTLIIN